MLMRAKRTWQVVVWLRENGWEALWWAGWALSIPLLAYLATFLGG